MDIKKLIFTLILLTLGQALTWFQLYGSIKYDILHNKWLLYMLALPIGFLFITGCKLGITYFEGLTWPVRIISFSVGNLVFFFMSYWLLNESLTIKSGICLFLCFVVILIQIFWK